MSDISKETHEALLAKAVSDGDLRNGEGVGAQDRRSSRPRRDEQRPGQEGAGAVGRQRPPQKELDTAQVSLKKATDEVAAFRADIAAKDEAARLSELASKRADQVKNLDLFPADYISEKASKWAALSDDDWASASKAGARRSPPSPPTPRPTPRPR